MLLWNFLVVIIVFLWCYKNDNLMIWFNKDSILFFIYIVYFYEKDNVVMCILVDLFICG